MDIILAVMSRVHYTMVSGSIGGGAIAAAASPTLAASMRRPGCQWADVAAEPELTGVLPFALDEGALGARCSLRFARGAAT